MPNMETNGLLEHLRTEGPATARARRYATHREIRGRGHAWPLYRIDATGRPTQTGTLHALSGGHFFLAIEPKPAWLRGEFCDGLFPSLPWPMDGMRPQGYLGRAFAHAVGPTLELHKALSQWNDDDIIAALLACDDDTPGQLVLGDTALESALTDAAAPIPVAQRGTAYVHLAEATAAGERPRSSAAGEQPKFTACVERTLAETANVIVKFTDPVADNPTAQRWADLLLAEHAANTILRGAGVAVAHTECLTANGRHFLESTRFDRIGLHGHSGVVSLAALDNAHYGGSDSWAEAAARLLQDGWIDAADAERMRLLWWFGRLIGNTDMHGGNLSFYLEDELPFQLAPVYDMLPMHYRPAASGGTDIAPHQPPPPRPADLPLWLHACHMARAFWQRLLQEAGLSSGFRAVATTQGSALDKLSKRFG